MQERIVIACRGITPETLQAARRSLHVPLQMCIAVNGKHVKHMPRKDLILVFTLPVFPPLRSSPLSDIAFRVLCPIKALRNVISPENVTLLSKQVALSPACSSADDLTRRAAVAERLACSPLAKVSRAQSPAGSPDYPKWQSCRTMPLAGGISRRSPVSPTPPFRRCSIFTSITLIGKQHGTTAAPVEPHTRSRSSPRPAADEPRWDDVTYTFMLGNLSSVAADNVADGSLPGSSDARRVPLAAVITPFDSWTLSRVPVDLVGSHLLLDAAGPHITGFLILALGFVVPLQTQHILAHAASWESAASGASGSEPAALRLQIGHPTTELSRLTESEPRLCGGQTTRLPPRRTGFDSRRGRSWIYACGYRAGRFRLSTGFLGDLSFTPPLYSGVAPYSPHFTLTGSQDLDVKSRPNLCTPPTFPLRLPPSSGAVGLCAASLRCGRLWVLIPGKAWVLVMS
ncbi:hypothetical protein PR048_009782 [Dryococelus australis]|uniref:Uncharacterized protein n=1 Tax=Dryococelus australis TaxID=614101 RepID=A0ABQ9I1U9_9NEOP|nr:hypothetical protein PR048_009782 [Dryococelus australis]